MNRRPRFGWLLAGLTLVCFVHNARALDPDRGMADYTRDRWGAEQGFPGANVYAVTQTADGYLWLGTERGLVRYDGVSFHLYGQADSPPKMLGDRDLNVTLTPFPKERRARPPKAEADEVAS